MDRRILVVDGNHVLCQQLVQQLARPDRRIKVAHDGTSALEWLVEGQFALVLTGLHIDEAGLGGLDLIREIHDRGLSVTTIVMTGSATIDSAVEAMRLGAYDYLTRPVDPLRLELVVDQALRDRRLRDEVASLRRGQGRCVSFHDLVGRGPRMREVFTRIARVASSSCNILITGETGTGKDLVAQALHRADTTRRGPLVTVNCGALPEPLLESELFGHERGAFTGADRLRQGRFEQADGGTLFLDEVSELPLGMQAKLLRVLQDGTFERVGGTETLRADVRILSATNLDLAAEVAAGRFREDLYFRLNVLTVDLPPLRERAIDDLPALVEHFLHQFRARGYPAPSFAREALDRMALYDWPGNVRELENLVEQLTVTAPGPVIRPEDLPPHIVPTREEPFRLDFDLQRPLQEITDELTARIEQNYLRKVLEQYRGRIDACATHCGLSRRSISEKLRRYRIDKADYKLRSTRSRKVNQDRVPG